MSENRPVNGRLDSWKEIAAYLNRDVRTVIRWEKEKGLPVHRVPGGKRQAVFTYRQELDAWLESEQIGLGQEDTSVAGNGLHKESLLAGIQKQTAPPINGSHDPQPVSNAGFIPDNGGEVRQARRRSLYRVLGVAAIVVTGIILSLWVFYARPAVNHLPSRVGFTMNSLQAFDDQGHLLWTHSFAMPVHPRFEKSVKLLPELVRIADLKRDGGREVLIVVPLARGPNPDDFFQTEVDCFSSQGELLWSYVPEERFRFGNYELDGPWFTFDVLVSTIDKKPAIWMTLAHYKWGNSFVVELDPDTGKGTLRFVNTGIVYKLNEMQAEGKTYLMAGGFNNEYEAGSLAVIEESKPFTVSPQTAGTRHKCVDCPEGAPDYYFVFPRSEINRLKGLWEDSVHSIAVNGDQIEVEKWEAYRPDVDRDSPEQSVGMHEYYDFHTLPTIQPFSFRFGSDYDMLHRELEKDHKLNHTLETCPERLHPEPVKVWTPSTGWKDIKLSPVRAVD